MTFDICLNDSTWEINGYFIEGNKEDGYTVYVYEDETPIAHNVYDSDDFEACLVWAINS